MQGGNWNPYAGQTYMPTQNPQRIMQPQYPVQQQIQQSSNQQTKVSEPQKPHIELAAPLPGLPKLLDISNALQEIEASIHATQVDLASYLHARSTAEINVTSTLEHSEACLGLVNYRSFLISHPKIDQVVRDNRAKAKAATSSARIECLPQFSHISHLPHTRTQIIKQSEITPILYTPIYWRKRVVKEKTEVLAHHYSQLQASWETQCNAIDVMNVKTHTCSDEWPIEIEPAPSKPFDAPDLTIGVAPDVEMLLDPLEKRAQCFADTNRFIADPVAEHEAFRKRHAWTEEEKRIFFDTFVMRPKKFAEIAALLPLKTVKDVIEFYYLAKSELSDHIKAAEVMQKRRGNKKKVITEGSVGTKEKK